MLIRPATNDDAEAIRAIYNIEVLNTTVTFDLVARSAEGQAEWMAAHAGVYPVIVADVDGEVVGFASLSAYRPRPAYSTTAEDSVYVAAPHRGQGVGKQLLAELVDLGESLGFHAIIARIVGDHTASIALHRSCGFEIIGTEHEVGRKFGKWLDVALMQRLF